MTAFRRILALASIAALAGASPGPAQTWKEYTEACSAMMGDLAPPAETLDCRDGTVLPITIDGVDIPATSAADAGRFTAATVCDKPPILADVSDGGIGQCVPNSTVQTGGGWSTGKPGYVLLCRNYVFRPLEEQAVAPRYDDVAMILYNPENGATCFFQQLSKTLTRVPEVEISDVRLPIDGTAVPWPLRAQAEPFWLPPDTIRAYTCTNCHSGYSVIRTPYVMQAKGTAPLPSLFRSKAYTIVSAKFREAWKSSHAFFDLKGGKTTVGACSTCHRVGKGLPAGALTAYSTATRPTPGQNPGLDFAQSHWMPPSPGEESKYKADYGAAITQLLSCAKDPTQPDCHLTHLSGKP